MKSINNQLRFMSVMSQDKIVQEFSFASNSIHQNVKVHINEVSHFKIQDLLLVEMISILFIFVLF